MEFEVHPPSSIEDVPLVELMYKKEDVPLVELMYKKEYVPLVESMYNNKKVCTSGGVYVPYTYAHAR